MAVLLDDAISSSNLVVVDVTSAQFIDSSFLHNLVKAHKSAQTRGSRFVLQMGTAPPVRRILEISWNARARGTKPWRKRPPDL